MKFNKLYESIMNENELIKFDSFNVNKDKINVSSSHTSYANATRAKYLDGAINNAMDKLKTVKKLAKEKGVRLKNYNKRVAELKSLGSKFDMAYKKYNKLFDDYYNAWKKIEKKKDLFYVPTSDLGERIPEYDQASKIRNEIDKMFWGGEVLSKVSSILSRLTSLIQDLSGSSSYSMVSV